MCRMPTRARGPHSAHRSEVTDAPPAARHPYLTAPAPLRLLPIGRSRPTVATGRRGSPSAARRGRSSPTSCRPLCRRRSRSPKRAPAPFRPRGRPDPHPSGPPRMQARTGEPSLPARVASKPGHRTKRPKPRRATPTAPPQARRPTTQPVRSDIHSPPQDDPAPGWISSVYPRFSTSPRSL